MDAAEVDVGSLGERVRRAPEAPLVVHEIPAAPGGPGTALPVAGTTSGESSTVDSGRGTSSVVSVGVEPDLRSHVREIAREFESTGSTRVHFRQDSSAGLRHALLHGKIDVVFSRKPLLHRERRRGLKSFDVVRHAWIPVVNQNNRVQKLDVARLGGLLTGQEKTWYELLRSPAGVEVVTSKDDGWRLLDTLLGGRSMAASRTVEDDTAVVDVIARSQSAIGLVELAALETSRAKSRVRLLSVDGIRPTTQNVSDRRWPLAWTLRLLTRGEDAQGVTSREAVRAFERYVLAAADLSSTRK